MAYKYNPISGQLDLVTDLTFTSITAGLGYTPVNVAGDTMLGNLILNADPTNPLGAATKQYVDNITIGLNFHSPVTAATTITLPVTAYADGPDPLNPGVGATLTALANGPLIIDGVDFSLLPVPSTPYRVLIKDQSLGFENGIYTVTVVGDSLTPFELTRATDADNSPTGELSYGDFCFVETGTANGGLGYILNTVGPITVGVTPISYVTFNAAQVVTAGYGLQELTPNVLSVDTSVILDNATAALTYLTIANASLTYVPYTGATGNVNLGANYLISPTIHGSSISSGTLTLSSTTNLTKGNILFGTSVYDETNNRLGIGTNSPNADLDIFYGTTFTAPKNLLRVRQFDTSREVFKIYDFGGSGGSQITSEYATWGFGMPADAPTANRLSIKGNTSGSGTASIIVQDSLSNYTFIVRDDGKVGIGTTTPDQSLDVRGNTLIRDNSVITPLNYDLEVHKTRNGEVSGWIRNNSVGNAAFAQVGTRVDSSTQFRMGILSNNYTTSGLFTAGTAYLLTAGTLASKILIGNQTSSKDIIFINGGTAAANEIFRISSSNTIDIYDARDITFGTTTGTKFGTSTTQKIGFYNATPIVQPAAVTTVQGIADALTSLGLLASSSIGSPTPNVQSVVSAATVTPTSANDEVIITAQAVALTLANPTGTPSEGQALTIRIKDDGTSQTIAYDTQYRALGVTLPTTTTVSKILYLGLIYNSTDTKWDVVGVSLEGSDPFTGNDWIDYSGSSTIVGWSSFTIKSLSYRIIGKQMFVMFSFLGTSNSTSVTFTLPNDAIGVSSFVTFGYAINNGVATGAGIVQRTSPNTITCYRDSIGNVWTASGTKRISGEFFIEIA